MPALSPQSRNEGGDHLQWGSVRLPEVRRQHGRASEAQRLVADQWRMTRQLESDIFDGARLALRRIGPP
jgi:hypothetical protein